MPLPFPRACRALAVVLLVMPALSASTAYALAEEQEPEPEPTYTLAATVSPAAMTAAGADIIVPHMGLTTKGTIGAQTAISLQDAARKVQSMHDAAKKVRSDVIVLCHGGPIAEPQDAEFIIRNTSGIAGFFGASSIERLPAELAITKQARRFKQLSSN